MISPKDAKKTKNTFAFIAPWGEIFSLIEFNLSQQSMLKRPLIVIVLLIFLAAPACVPLAVATPLPTFTPTPAVPASTSTPTPVWFPPTATPTPLPTREITPTPEQRPGIGEEILSDEFNDPTMWALASSDQGTVALGENELSIAIQSGKSYIYSLRKEPVLSNFYLEITAGPTLCSGQDEYGVLLRASGNRDGYRFGLSCDGQTRLDRIAGFEANNLQPWSISGAFPPGAPSLSKIGVWASGGELRFFINDYFLFTIRDPQISSGQIGVYARSSGAGSLTVLFSKLIVHELNP